MKTIHETNNALEAEAIRAYLSAYGIEAIIVGKAEDRSGAFAPGRGTSPIRVQVMEESFEEAKGLLEARPQEENEQNLPGE